MQTRQGSPPSYLRWSKMNLAAHLRALLPAGRPSLSVGVRQRYGPIHTVRCTGKHVPVLLLVQPHLLLSPEDIKNMLNLACTLCHGALL